ncbi:MAG: TetR/AcrR family transcriptional regulator [Gammaproteobacteria bacterium]
MKSPERILDAAEKLFAEKGYDAASLRAITSEARVNLAAVNYHFRSKEALLQAVFARRLGPLNRERLELLDDCEAAAGNGSPVLEEILAALIAPVLRLGQSPEGAAFTKLIGSMFAHPGEGLQRIFMEQLRDISLRFVAALRRARPQLPPEDVYWRIHFTIGCMAHTLARAQLLSLVSNGRCDSSDTEKAISKIIPFVAGGWRSPAPLGKRSFKRRPRGAVKSASRGKPRL